MPPRPLPLDSAGAIIKKFLRQGCHCIESRDIGAYDTCLNGCKYCYANRDPHRAFENFRRHDPASPLLLGHVRPEDTVTQGVQRPFRRQA